MMRSPIHLRSALFAAIALTMIAGQHLGAQQSSPAGQPSPIMQKLAEELGRTSGEYWTPKLNEYKVKIDSLLAPADLDSLNRLRVRWAILMERQLDTVKDDHKNPLDPQDTARLMELARAHDTAAVMKLTNPKMAPLFERIEIYESATRLAERNRSALRGLGTKVIDDYVASAQLMSDATDHFIEENRAAAEQDPVAKRIMEGQQSTREAIALYSSRKWKKSLTITYTLIIEPLVLLYNGVEIDNILTHDPGSVFLLNPTVTSSIAVPAMSALKQNFPNPASTSTTIPFLLTEASSTTIIRLFDAKGDLVATYDQGTLAAGEHTFNVDVSELPTGTYLYHLTIHTSKGDRVFSKAMQVVH